MQSNQEIRLYVSKNISGKQGTIFLALFIISAISGVFTSFIDTNEQSLQLLINLIISGLTTPLIVGFYKLLIDLVNNKKVNFSQLFDYYQYIYPLFFVGILANLAISVGSILIVPGIILKIIYTGALYIFAVHPTKDFHFLSEANENLNNKKLQFFTLCLSYVWPIILIFFAYIIILVGTLITSGISLASLYGNALMWNAFGNVLFSSLTIIILSIVFLIALIVYAIMVIPSLNLAVARFMTLGIVPEVKKEEHFCPNCGTRVETHYCTNCGTKVE
jgi:hypothetical protein